MQDSRNGKPADEACGARHTGPGQALPARGAGCRPCPPLAAAFVLCLCLPGGPARAGDPGEGPPTFPRVRGPAGPATSAANRILELRERADRHDRAVCVGLFRGPAGRAGGHYHETVRVTFRSLSLLSVEVRVDTSCGPHPENGVPRPLTLDLGAGTELDWREAFRPGFLPDGPGGGPGAPPATLTSMYLRAYRTGPGVHPEECRLHVASGTEWALRLDGRSRGLVAEPLLPSANRACAEPMTVPLAAVRDRIADLRLLETPLPQGDVPFPYRHHRQP